MKSFYGFRRYLFIFLLFIFINLKKIYFIILIMLCKNFKFLLLNFPLYININKYVFKLQKREYLRSI